MKWCGCFATLPLREAISTTWDEVVEFVRDPSMDEASDIAFGIGRICGSVTHRPYVHMPGDRLHVEKVQDRMDDYGCIRSRRHLRDGGCPST